VSAPRDFRWGGGWYGAAASTKPSIPERDQRTDDEAWTAFSHLVAGMLLYGGLGWLVGARLGNPGAFLAGGVLIGLASAFFLIHRRLERPDVEPTSSRHTGSGDPAGREAESPMDRAGLSQSTEASRGR